MFSQIIKNHIGLTMMVLVAATLVTLSSGDDIQTTTGNLGGTSISVAHNEPLRALAKKDKKMNNKPTTKAKKNNKNKKTKGGNKPVIKATKDQKTNAKGKSGKDGKSCKKDCEEEAEEPVTGPPLDTFFPFPVDTHTTLFAEDPTLVYPLYSVEGWTGEETTYQANTFSGIAFSFAVTSILTEWGELEQGIMDDDELNPEQETLDFIETADYQATAVYGTLTSDVGDQQHIIGMVIEYTDQDGPHQTLIVVDEPGEGYDINRRRLQAEECGDFLAEALDAVSCETGEELIIDPDCVSQAVSTYNVLVAAARGDFDTDISDATIAKDAALLALKAARLRKYALALAACARLRFLPAVAACALVRTAQLVAEQIAIKVSIDLAFDTAIENADVILRAALFLACNRGKDKTAECLSCETCDATDANIECCVDSDCGDPSTFSCETNICVFDGNPRFTLIWSGDGEWFNLVQCVYPALNVSASHMPPSFRRSKMIWTCMHVVTPGGAEIFFENTIDSVSNGMLDEDDIPTVVGNWVENIFFPLDGSAPAGTYTYFVRNFTQKNGADNWILRVYLGDRIMESHAGVTVDSGTDSVQYRFTFQMA